MKTLVVYHSRSGYTRRIAERLAARLHADIEAIETQKSRAGPLGYLSCVLEALGEFPTEVHRSTHDPAAYDLVVVGTPVWFWRLSSPVRTWLMHARRRLPSNVAFFCTMGSSGSARAFDMMSKVGHRTPLATLALTDGDIEHRRFGRLEAFVKLLQSPAATAPPRTTRATRRTAARHAGAAA
jgi:menaquinone-dependent protoporphyrinogen IX oxidase